MVDRIPEISISVVSHHQIQLVEMLLHDIETICSASSLEVLLTLNLEEVLPFNPQDFPFQIKIIRNPSPQGFASNHNQAFLYAKGEYFCVLNPDIRLHDDPFHILLPYLHDRSLGVVAPLVLSADGAIEDSARRFPTPFKIFCKALGGCKDADYSIGDVAIFPDWVGGMFMLFRREVFVAIGGFDTRFFLYYEDVDLCARLRLQGFEVALNPSAKVEHEARRDSHRKARFLKWHLTSALRFFSSSVYWRLLFR